jgi:hypothetical protein
MNNEKLAGKIGSIWINNNNIFHILKGSFTYLSHQSPPHILPPHRTLDGFDLTTHMIPRETKQQQTHNVRNSLQR